MSESSHPLPRDFTLITTNAVLHRRPRLIAEDDVSICTCRRRESEASTICASDACENWLTRTECVIGFCSSSRCSNQRLQRLKGASNGEVFNAGKKGLGLRVPAEAAEGLVAGGIVSEYCGEVINDREHARRMQETTAKGNRHFFMMALSRGEYLDASRKGTLARFINHSCDPNAASQVWQVGLESRVAIAAKRDIAPGEEITMDYGWDRAADANMACYCGASVCSGFLGIKRDEGNTVDALPPGRWSRPTPQQLSLKGAPSLVGKWVRILWKGDKAEDVLPAEEDLLTSSEEDESEEEEGEAEGGEKHGTEKRGAKKNEKQRVQASSSSSSGGGRVMDLREDGNKQQPRIAASDDNGEAGKSEGPAAESEAAGEHGRKASASSSSANSSSSSSVSIKNSNSLGEPSNGEKEGSKASTATAIKHRKLTSAEKRQEFRSLVMKATRAGTWYVGRVQSWNAARRRHAVIYTADGDTQDNEYLWGEAEADAAGGAPRPGEEEDDELDDDGEKRKASLWEILEPITSQADMNTVLQTARDCNVDTRGVYRPLQAAASSPSSALASPMLVGNGTISIPAGGSSNLNSTSSSTTAASASSSSLSKSSSAAAESLFVDVVIRSNVIFHDTYGPEPDRFKEAPPISEDEGEASDDALHDDSQHPNQHHPSRRKASSHSPPYHRQNTSSSGEGSKPSASAILAEELRRQQMRVISSIVIPRSAPLTTSSTEGGVAFAEGGGAQQSSSFSTGNAPLNEWSAPPPITTAAAAAAAVASAAFGGPAILISPSITASSGTSRSGSSGATSSGSSSAIVSPTATAASTISAFAIAQQAAAADAAARKESQDQQARALAAVLKEQYLQKKAADAAAAVEAATKGAAAPPLANTLPSSSSGGPTQKRSREDAEDAGGAIMKDAGGAASAPSDPKKHRSEEQQTSASSSAAPLPFFPSSSSFLSPTEGIGLSMTLIGVSSSAASAGGDGGGDAARSSKSHSFASKHHRHHHHKASSRHRSKESASAETPAESTEATLSSSAANSSSATSAAAATAAPSSSLPSPSNILRLVPKHVRNAALQTIKDALKPKLLREGEMPELGGRELSKEAFKIISKVAFERFCEGYAAKHADNSIAAAAAPSVGAEDEASIVPLTPPLALLAQTCLEEATSAHRLA